MTGFRVDPGFLDAQAGRMDRVADRVRAAAAVGLPLDLGAYGVLGRVFALAALDAASTGASAVDRLAGQATEHAERLRAAAADYRRAEQAAAAELGGPR